MSKKTDNDTEKIHESFTEEQLSEIREAFNLFPQDRECIRADSVETLLRALGHNPSPEEMQKIFKHLHIYSQSKVSFNMLLSVIAMLFSSCSEESIRQAFRMFDKDGNGTIDSRELRHVMLNLGEALTDDEVDDMIREIDVDGDGEVDCEEFVMMMKK
ncbi:calmodulin-A-like [Bolinopsis microptera]|uniref:calmodulin-A-like n=1 Tax=Bolinopsis microptera TaxID=2820187 RepID=UPI0030795495